MLLHARGVMEKNYDIDGVFGAYPLIKIERLLKSARLGSGAPEKLLAMLMQLPAD